MIFLFRTSLHAQWTQIHLAIMKEWSRMDFLYSWSGTGSKGKAKFSIVWDDTLYIQEKICFKLKFKMQNLQRVCCDTGIKTLLTRYISFVYDLIGKDQCSKFSSFHIRWKSAYSVITRLRNRWTFYVDNW